MTSVKAKSGQVSTRNAGAKASPVDVPPTRPSKPGTTHHQGSGSRPLSTATKGLSTCSNLGIVHSTQHTVNGYIPGKGLGYVLDAFAHW